MEQYLRHYINYTQNNWVLLLLVIQFIYNATPQEGLKISLFKANYSYTLKTLLTPRQAKKTSELAQKKVDRLIRLYLDLCDFVKLV